MATYTLISSVTVGSGGSSTISFTSIPQTYTDLVILGSDRIDTADGFPWREYNLRFNSSTSNFSNKWLLGINSGVQTATETANIYVRSVGSLATTNIFSSEYIYISNYTGSTNKSVYLDYAEENNSSSTYLLGIAAGLWADTSAITSIQLVPVSGNFIQYSNVYLYGISNA